ncbi:uncharacterized protein LOC115621488 isoform X2 [Scaptodrosophila lebanonensis]|uniref:Uncharacterized protein LOC115621488 isoform X2 n=1 Tax=Drosophila lebanonensis TaxID=7225 RepID=A0A6J2T6V4_DROLE|nr:uncharacterized protein LOC115621488 isoform X2 [Scaptodrosophila lebanonensis]
MQPARRRFFSTGAKYAGNTEEDLELGIKYYGEEVVRMELVNRQHRAQCRSQLNRMLVLFGLAALYLSFAIKFSEHPVTFGQAQILYPVLLFLTIFMIILHSSSRLVQSEKVFYSWDLALQTEIVRTFGRESYCVQRGNLHDIVINELDIKYMLILRTKGNLFRERPIIPLFHSLSPSLECLQHIRSHLHKCWLNGKTDRSERAYSKEKPSMVAS